METTEKRKVYTLEGAMKELGVSRSTFETSIKHKLTEIPKIEKRRYYLYDEIQRIKQERANKAAMYEIIA
jgi:uncharacterized small protein (DUF1192 family)